MKNENEKDKLININGKLLKKKLLERLTKIAQECHERKCVCENCDIFELESLKKEECQIKDYVEGYIFLGRLPKIKK